MRHILLSVLALAALTVSCVDPLEPVLSVNSNISGDALVFSPKVLGITPATKTTPGETDRGENTVTRIDVFVYKTTGGTSTFHKHYTIGDGTQAIQTSVDYLLESNWRTEYTVNDTYRVYAIANINANKLNDPVLPASPTEAQLKVLTSESDATIAGQYGYTCYDIVRLKNPNGANPAAQSLDHHIGSKLFLMDGKVDGWRIKNNSAKQYITTVPDQSVLDFNLSRAAAKFRVELNFSEAFKTSLGTADADGLKFTTVTEYQDKMDDQGQPVLDDGGLPVQIPKTEKIITIGAIAENAAGKIYANGVVTGGARAKFANILKATYNVAPDGVSPTAAEQAAFRDANLWDSQSFYEFSSRTLRNPNDINGGYKYPYVDTTYSYAFGWDADEAAEKAPALAVSIVYTTYTQKYTATGEFDGEAVSDGGVTNYYRIPLIDITKTGQDAVNEIKRNYYYQVTAEINTMGTSTTEIEPTKVDLKYKIIPWPDAPDEVTDAQTTQLQYFVAEREYRLRGDGVQATNLQYFTPKSDPISTGSTYNKATPRIRKIKVYYVDQNGVEQVLATSTAAEDATGLYTWSGNGVTITVLPSSQHNGGGDFQVSSTSLANRSVRYIEFEAYVDFSYDGGTEVTRNIKVSHFPLDNIQSILGWWSSRWDGQAATGTTTTYYRKVFYNRVETPVSINQQTWAQGIGSDNDDRRNASDRDHAINGYYATGGSNSTETINVSSLYSNRRSILSITGYTWNNNNNRRVTISGTRTNNYEGTTTTNWTYTINNNNHDYVMSAVVNEPGTNGNYATITLHKYTNYYYLDVQEDHSYSETGDDGTWTSYDRWEWEVCTPAQYNATAPENRKVETTKNAPGTGTWVAYNPTKSGTYQGTTYAGTGSGFYAKVYEEGRDANNPYRIFRITGDGEWGTISNVADENGRNNPHMYVIQISKAEEGVILGRPQVSSTTYQSNDNVVSPAFMIASQLGAVSSASYDASNAATHCHTYMEVAENGYRFVNWRLPTKAEIAYIVKYQNDPNIQGQGVFSNVLTGYAYYTLDGGSTTTGYTDDTGTFVRCIRDLTPAEVIELNETGTITAASY